MLIVLIAIGILSHLKTDKWFRGQRKLQICIWHLQDKHSPFTLQQTVIQHNAFAVFLFALIKGFKEKLTAARAVWAAMIFKTRNFIEMYVFTKANKGKLIGNNDHLFILTIHLLKSYFIITLQFIHMILFLFRCF